MSYNNGKVASGIARIATCGVAFAVIGVTLAKPSKRIQADDRVIQRRISLASIVDAWKQQEDSVRSAIFEWSEQRLQTQQFLGPDEYLAEPFVPHYEAHGRLSIDGDRLRYSCRKSIWPEAAPRNANRLVSVFDGEESRIYLPPGYVAEYPRGHVSRQPHSEELTSVYLKPFLWSFRTVFPRVLPTSIEQFQIAVERNLFRNRECVVLTFPASTAQVFELWLDPARAYSIVRQMLITDGRVGQQFDIDYQFDEHADVWIPQQWRFSMLDASGTPSLSVTGHLTRYEINPVLSDSEFEFEFPPGTWVHDGDQQQYIVRPDGGTRQLFGEDVHRPYQDLLKDAAFHGKRWLLVWINASALALLVAWLLFNRYRAHHIGPT